MTPWDVAVVGEGPGGLYLSIVLRRDSPDSRVAEGSPAGETYAACSRPLWGGAFLPVIPGDPSYVDRIHPA